MSVRRVMGIETEYGVLQPGRPLANPMLLSSQVVTTYRAISTRAEGAGGKARWDYDDEDPLQDARGFHLDRAKKSAIKDFLSSGQRGIRVDHLLTACVDEFRENEDLPNTTNPDDWARISGKKGERIVYVRTLVGNTREAAGPTGGRSIERVATGQYL